MRFQHSLLIVALASATSATWAGISADEAKQLGTTLTASPFLNPVTSEPTVVIVPAAS